MSTKGIPALPVFSGSPPRYQYKINSPSPKCTPEITNIIQVQEISQNELRNDIVPEITKTELNLESGLSMQLHSLPETQYSQSFPHCRNCTPQSMSLPVSNNQPRLNSSFQCDKLFDKPDIAANCPYPFKFSIPNLNNNRMPNPYPSFGNAPVIDNRMSDILLLAIYKGFQSPEFQQYMCSIEKNLLAQSQVLPNTPSSSFLLSDSSIQPSMNEITASKAQSEAESELLNIRDNSNFYSNQKSPQMELADNLEEFSKSKAKKSISTPYYSDNSIHVLQTQPNMLSHGDGIDSLQSPLNHNIDHKEYFHELHIVLPESDVSSQINATSHNTNDENLSTLESNNPSITSYNLPNVS